MFIILAALTVTSFVLAQAFAQPFENKLPRQNINTSVQGEYYLWEHNKFGSANPFVCGDRLCNQTGDTTNFSVIDMLKHGGSAKSPICGVEKCNTFSQLTSNGKFLLRAQIPK